MNGAVQSGLATALPLTQIFASPLRFAGKWNPQPHLAESWKLAEGGKPITSAHVALSIMAIKANCLFTTMLGPVEKVETPDHYAAIIHMSTPLGVIQKWLVSVNPVLVPLSSESRTESGLKVTHV